MENFVSILCPRCGMGPDHESGRLLALSRHDNKTHVCEACGMDEALINAGLKKRQTTLAAWKGK